MRFGGHQTFPIREGWLYKGLRMAIKEPDRLAANDLADWLGVGRNMAKAIHHWLLATGLAEKDPEHGANSKILRPTQLGRDIWEQDKYFLLPGTWWAVHIQLIHRQEDAFSWSWFFNHFAAARFERPVCVESLRRYLAARGNRMPASRTLDRDVSCLLKSYSLNVPRQQADPEDATECPLSELGLLVHSRQTGFHHLNLDLKSIPFSLFGYAVALTEAFAWKEGRAGIDLSLTELTYRPNAPGRTFVLTAEATYELVASYEAERLLRLDGQAGERIVRLESLPPREWLIRYYASISERAEDAA